MPRIVWRLALVKEVLSAVLGGGGHVHCRCILTKVSRINDLLPSHKWDSHITPFKAWGTFQKMGLRECKIYKKKGSSVEF